MSTDGRAVKPPSGGRSVDCEKIRGQLFDYLSHELGGGPSTLVREHLRRCPACAAWGTLEEEVVATRPPIPSTVAAVPIVAFSSLGQLEEVVAALQSDRPPLPEGLPIW